MQPSWFYHLYSEECELVSWVEVPDDGARVRRQVGHHPAVLHCGGAVQSAEASLQRTAGRHSRGLERDALIVDHHHTSHILARLQYSNCDYAVRIV